MGLIRLVRILRSENVVLSWFAIKTTLVGGIVYCSYEEGLWSKPEETAKLYTKIYNNVAPYVKENVPKEITQELAELPSVNNVTSYMKTSWNKGVMTSMEFLSHLPCNVTKGVNSLSGTVQKYMKQLNQSEGN